MEYELDGVQPTEQGCPITEPSMAGASGPLGVPAKPRKSHCVRGHAYTPENTIWAANGKYRCRACKSYNAKLFKRRRAVARYFNRGIRGEPNSPVPVVRQLFALATEAGVSCRQLGIMAGYNESNISTWRTGAARPYITAVVDLYNALGYDLIPVKRAKQ